MKKKTEMIQDKIIANHGRYEVYLNGKFLCYADSIMDAAKKLKKKWRNHNG